MDEMTNEQLNDLCTYLSVTPYIYYPVANDYFKDLLVTGARPAELLDFTNWMLVPPGKAILFPDKGNDPREFNVSDLSESLVFSIQNNVPPYNGLTKRQLNSVMRKIMPPVEIKTDEKATADYLFRYNKVKSLKDAGMDWDDITNSFGWSSNALAVGYYTRKLFYSGPLPPPVSNYLIDSDGTQIIDSDGTFIIGA